MEDKELGEEFGALEAAAVTAEMAAANIRRYLDLHSGARAHYVMKMIEGARDDIGKITQQSIEVAARRLDAATRHLPE